ncbi:MAG: response regulator [Candidatus Pacebacteria bacterium]|nr:response regulator [Candidatus Paceibacterota bacterium]
MTTQTQKRILVVEDDQALNMALVEKLKDADYVVDTTFDGEKGLEVALAKKPDLILLDLLMPVMDGYEFMTSLRADEWGNTAKVIILTNFSMSEEKVAQTVIDKKPLSFLVKSSTKLKHLVGYIKEALSSK